MISRPSNRLALVFVALLCVGFAPAAFGEETAEAPAAADIPSLVSAIENAADSSAAGAVYNGARRKGIEHVDLAQAYVHKMVGFGKVLQAMEAATKVTRARDDDATVWGVLSYCHSLRRRYGPAIDAATRVADLTPKDPVAMANIGELMGWLVSQTKLPELSADARRIMAANQNTWPTDANYVRGYQRISTAYKAFANKLKAKKDELDGLREQGEKLVEQIGLKTAEIKASLARQRQMEEAGSGDGGGGGWALS
ncbi:MAG TPA: hypothetical protein ENH80_02110, partial [Phycisphaerae bacterium]|nr:hypothetical protein [Phycisphaerae bacterium]